MKTTTLKRYIDVHSWTGLGAGLFLFIAFYAGAITVFSKNIDNWNSYSYTASEQQTLSQAQSLLDLVIDTQAVAGENLQLNFSNKDYPFHEVLWNKRLEDGTEEKLIFRLNKKGKLISSQDESRLANFIYTLHYNLGIPGKWGRHLMGIICLLYGIALVSGVIIFLPNIFSNLFVVRPGKNKKQFWQDTHNVVGVLSLPWHIMFAWSSAILAMVFFMLAPFQLTVFDKSISQMLGPQMGFIQSPDPSGNTGAMLSLDKLVLNAQSVSPDLAISQLNLINAGDTNAVVRLIGNTHTQHVDSSATITLMANDGKIISASHPETNSLGSTFYRGLLSLHFVSYGGYLSKWLNFILAIGGAYLFYSGNLLWIESRRRRRQVIQKSSAIVLAKLNSGVCIGCMAGISAAFLSTRAFSHLSDKAFLMEYSYFAVLFGAIIWCFLRPVAKGTRDILYACSLFTFAIPVFDHLFLDISPWAMAKAGYWNVALVDLVSLSASIIFLLMAMAMHRRAINGTSYSVWAIQRNVD